MANNIRQINPEDCWITNGTTGKIIGVVPANGSQTQIFPTYSADLSRLVSPSGQPSLIADQIMTKIKASISAAEHGNILTNPAIINTKTGQSLAAANTVPAAIAYQANAYYNYGVIVQNAGNLYLNRSVGTAGAASAPTGTGAAAQADGGCSWTYIGTLKQTTDDPQAPTVTFAAPAGGLTQQINPFTSQSNFLFQGGSSLDTVNAKILAIRDNVALTKNQQHGVAISFMTDAPVVNISGANPLYNTLYVRIAVDDRWLLNGSLSVATLINPAGYNLDFTASGGRKPRKITIYQPQGGAFGVISIDPASSIWKPSNPNRFKFAMWGDSLLQGGDGTPYMPGADAVTQLAQMLGTDDYVNLGVGGTGFLSDNGGAKATHIQRIQDVLDYAPDILCVCGNHNDATYTSAQRQAAILTWLQTMRASLPNTIVIVFGSLRLQGETTSGTSSTIDACEADMLAAFNSWNDTRSFYVPIDADPQGKWLIGSGTAAAPSGTVGYNYDVYNRGGGDAHPNQAAVNYLAQRYYQAIRNILNF